MKILVFWDIYWRIWRKWFINEYKKNYEKFKPDFSIVNIENITSGRGPVSEHAELIESVWVDLMTSWDHTFDNSPNILTYLNKEDSKLIRPANFYDSDEYELSWKWYLVIEKKGKKLLVINLLWESFMNHKVKNPFLTVEKILKEVPEKDYDAIIVEFHRETTAELYGMANFLDGRVAFVYGTHTHIQTNDAHILPNGTGMISDVWMNWPFHSVIWAEFSSVKKRFLSWISRWKIVQQLKGPYIINAVYFEIDDDSGLCTHVENISYTNSL